MVNLFTEPVTTNAPSVEHPPILSLREGESAEKTFREQVEKCFTVRIFEEQNGKRVGADQIIHRVEEWKSDTHGGVRHAEIIGRNTTRKRTPMISTSNR